jgi:hypothetical protein
VAGGGHIGAGEGEMADGNGLNTIDGELRCGVNTSRGISGSEVERRGVAGGDGRKRQWSVGVGGRQN